MVTRLLLSFHIIRGIKRLLRLILEEIARNWFCLRVSFSAQFILCVSCNLARIRESKYLLGLSESNCSVSLSLHELTNFSGTLWSTYHHLLSQTFSNRLRDDKPSIHIWLARKWNLYACLPVSTLGMLGYIVPSWLYLETWSSTQNSSKCLLCSSVQLPPPAHTYISLGNRPCILPWRMDFVLRKLLYIVPVWRAGLPRCWG